MHSLGADLNTYAYVHGRAFVATDPTGLGENEQKGVSEEDPVSTPNPAVNATVAAQGQSADCQCSVADPLLKKIQDSYSPDVAKAEGEFKAMRGNVPPSASDIASPVKDAMREGYAIMRNGRTGADQAVGAVIGTVMLAMTAPAELMTVPHYVGLVGQSALDVTHHDLNGATEHLFTGALGMAMAMAPDLEEARVAGPVTAVEDGVIYLRRDVTGALKDYVGQAESPARFLARQAEHAEDFPGSSFEFHVLDRASAGEALDVAEESWIRAGGGPTNKMNPNGGLSNGRYQMNDAAYKAAGGSVPLPGDN